MKEADRALSRGSAAAGFRWGAADRLLLGLAGAACVGCLALPVSNPDLFWHLSAARRLWELRAIPGEDWLSSTRAGVAWVDFEWLSQILYGLLHTVGGMAGLWAFKASLLGAAGWVLWATLRLYGTAPSVQAAALALWAAANLTRSDARPELFSVLGFGVLFFWLERDRLVGATSGRGYLLPFFALWANLHPGFAYGLMLLAFYAAGRGRGPWGGVGLAAAGTLLQPFGWSQAGVLWTHCRDMGSLETYISEWGAVRLENPWHWPYWALLAISFFAALARARIPPTMPLGPLAALLACALSASRHARLGGYFAAVAIPLSAHWLSESFGPRWIERGRDVSRPARWAAAVLVILCAAFTFWCGRSFGAFSKVFHDRFVPIRAADFLEREVAVLSGRGLYNPWGWGGYLGWRLYPAYRVFQDGRYLFHPLLEEAARGIADPEAWESFLSRYRVEVAVLENLPLRLETLRRYPDGSARPFLRPYYAVYMPKERWALVHWDEKALVFVRKQAALRRWTERLEFRYARPHDEAALRDALERGEAPAKQVEAEFRRRSSLDGPGPR